MVSNLTRNKLSRSAEWWRIVTVLLLFVSCHHHHAIFVLRQNVAVSYNRHIEVHYNSIITYFADHLATKHSSRSPTKLMSCLNWSEIECIRFLHASSSPLSPPPSISRIHNDECFINFAKINEAKLWVMCFFYLSLSRSLSLWLFSSLSQVI